MRVLLVGAITLLFLAPAAADPLTVLSPPEDVAATYDGDTDTLTLSWTHPDAEEMTFNVYQNGLLIASTAATTITIPASAMWVYFVTAEDENGTESPPSQFPWPWPLSEYLPDCSLAHIELVIFYVHWWCVDEYRESIPDVTLV